MSRLGLALLALALATGCAGDLVVRAQRLQQPGGDSALARVAPRAVALLPVMGSQSSLEPVGRVAGKLGRGEGGILLTEDTGDVLRRLVAQELRGAGHRLVEPAEADVVIALRVVEFRIDAPAVNVGWEIQARVRMLARVSRKPDSDAFGEYSYMAERSAQTVAAPGVSSVERLLGECLGDLARLVAERRDLARALEHYAGLGS